MSSAHILRASAEYDAVICFDLTLEKDGRRCVWEIERCVWGLRGWEYRCEADRSISAGTLSTLPDAVAKRCEFEAQIATARTLGWV
jgi:hypothetical protein